jgi:hypothetical protein
LTTQNQPIRHTSTHKRNANKKISSLDSSKVKSINSNSFKETTLNSMNSSTHSKASTLSYSQKRNVLKKNRGKIVFI